MTKSSIIKKLSESGVKNPKQSTKQMIYLLMEQNIVVDCLLKWFTELTQERNKLDRKLNIIVEYIKNQEMV